MAGKDAKVIVYAASWCAYCRAVKEYLKSRSVVFEEIDVEHDPHAAQAIVEKTRQAGIPVIEIGDETILGFDRQRIDLALRANKLV
jgi:glutaredoxin-like YruB-family protein